MKKKIVGIIIVLLFCFSNSEGQAPNNDHLARLKQSLNTLKVDTAKVLTLQDISDFFVNKIDSGLFYSLKASELAHKVKYREGEMKSLLQIEIILRHSGNTVKAFSAASRGLKLAIQYKDAFYQAQFLGELGIILGGRINFDIALSYLRQAKSLYRSIHEHEMSAYMDNNIGEVFLNKGELDSAQFYCQVCYNAPTPRYYWIKFYASLNLGKVNLRKSNYNEALVYFRNSLETALFYSHFFNCNLYLAKTYLYLNERDSCLQFANKAMEIATESRITSQREAANAFFASIYEKTDPGKALAYTRAALNYKDSSTQFNEKLMIERFNEFDTQERQYEIEASQIDYKNKVRTYAFLTSALILMMIALILYRNNRLKQKINRKLGDTVSHLKATQSQLIQSEKMASLGELTAGIAHEIQNPLNFVNNFSEVNKDLLAEMTEEMERGNLGEAKQLAKNVIDNQDKINHHGKRAEAIVKGMLQHSRTSSGQKEPTDINALCDEYLRLAYHGFRAKDKNFNAKIETDFDAGIGKISVIPQDFGRVLVNLINNAFYAASLPSKGGISEQGSHKNPTISVSTRKNGNTILISVRDNGPGIPQKILDKIFQPFFTTKPTGQGTGLGLSLSYDIVKAHGGEIKVETGEGAGTTFIIQLPAV